MKAATGAAAGHRPAGSGRPLRIVIVALLALMATFAPGVVSPSAASPPAGFTSGCAAPESHEELRPARPERERPRPVLPQTLPPAPDRPSGGAGPALCAQGGFAWKPVEALPHPLERIPVRRN